MQKTKLKPLMLKGFLVWLVLSVVFWLTGDAFIKALFPLLRTVMLMMTPELSTRLEFVKSTQSDSLIQLTAFVLKPIYLHSGRSIPIGVDLKTSAHLLHALVPLVIESTILLVWPVQHWKQRVILLSLGVITAIMVVMAVLPAQLLGNLEISFQNIAMTGDKPRVVPWFVDWMVFCEMGGRWLLGVVAAALCIKAQSRFAKLR